jgi:hypothetical protein
MVQKACQNCLDYFLQTKEKMSADDNPYDALKNHLLAVLRKSQNKEHKTSPLSFLSITDLFG